jgi:hypothetical protein
MASNKKDSDNSLAGWAEIILKPNDKIEEFFNKADEINKNRQEAAELFHKLWGEAHDSSDYNKENWKRMQYLLDKLGIQEV